MAKLQRWLRGGLLATAAISLAAFVLESGPIERDLTTRIAARLAADGATWAAVTVRGRDVVVSGTAPSTEAVRAALAAVADITGVGDVADATDLLPVAAPYLWSARRAGQMVIVSGSVPSESIRNSVLASARRALPAAEIHDEMKLARGAAAGFNAGTGFAFARLADLGEGTVTLTDATLSISGIAASQQAYGQAHAALASELPSAIALGPVDILPARADPFVWSANYDGGKVALSGFVPNEVVHETLLATLKATLPRAAAEDKTAVASGEPEGFAEAATFAIAALGRLSSGGVTLDGMKLDIAGVARSIDDYEAALDGLKEGLPAGMKVVSNAIQPAVVSPYGWKGERDGRTVVLSGYVPSPEGKAEIAAASHRLFAGLEVSDKLRIAAGEPKMDWIGGIEFAMGELARLGHGAVTLGDRTLSIEGEAVSPEAFGDLVAINARTLPASLTLARADVTPPKVSPYRLVVVAAAGQVQLGGFAPAEKDRQAIVEAARKDFADSQVSDKLVFAGGAPADYVPAAAAAMQAIARLGGGRGELVDNVVTIRGAAYNPATAAEIAAAAAATFPKSLTLKTEIVTRQEGQPLAAGRCRDLTQAVAQHGHVEFEPSKTAITADSYGLLDRIAATLVRCPAVKVEVGAHTDAGGSAAKNRELTQARADAVVDYLVDAGVRRERLTGTGYGDTKPIADNATAQGKAANRRVEFTVVVPEGG
jgi:outer membrane protein OmpA-like peptidoglycan-associated protein/osmotically-inducible protein OsmY